MSSAVCTTNIAGYSFRKGHGFVRSKNGGFVSNWYRICAVWVGTIVLATVSAVLAQPSDTPLNPFASDPAGIAAGQKVFDSTCTACHGEGATGAVGRR